MPNVLIICTANYYRSRFCEHLFNCMAKQQHLDWTATSRGVATELGVGNWGSISPFTIQGLKSLGVTLPDEFRDPMQLTEQDLKSADLVIVLDAYEHRPFMTMKFPDWADKVTYWNVGDLHVISSQQALALAEGQTRLLIQQLRSSNIPRKHTLTLQSRDAPATSE